MVYKEKHHYFHCALFKTESIAANARYTYIYKLYKVFYNQTIFKLPQKGTTTWLLSKLFYIASGVLQ